MKHFLILRLLYRISGHLDNKYPYFGRFHYLLNDVRHKYIMKNLRPYLLESLTQLNELNSISYTEFTNIIWIFWWQGIKLMPIIVRKCIESIIRNSGKYKVIIVNKNNVKKFANLPGYIYKKVLLGYISLTEFSDILRYNLLRNYGGLWIDSTNYCTGIINYNYFNDYNLLITSGCYNHYNFYISNKWAESLIGGYKNERLFIFIDLFFKRYWKDNYYLISYNLIDYALYYAYLHNIGLFKYYVDKTSSHNNPHMFDLVKYLNLPYNIQIYNTLTNDTHIFKLTYKQNFKNKPNTFYYNIIHNNL